LDLLPTEDEVRIFKELWYRQYFPLKT
jgi:hypothetical protein